MNIKSTFSEKVGGGLTHSAGATHRHDWSIGWERRISEPTRLSRSQRVVRIQVQAPWNSPLCTVFVGSHIDHRDRLLRVKPPSQGLRIDLPGHRC